jgi:plasmid stabilization system protein ParE
MSLPVIFRPIARGELNDAAAWYERQKPGLGGEFTAAVDGIISRISANPQRFRPVRPDVRRALMERFPYSIHYAVESEAIVILGVFHHRRDPRSLEGRK